MAWYYGTFSCGHEGRVNIIGPQKFRQYKIDREFEKSCPECRKKIIIERYKLENEENLKKSKEMELPELAGSEKQIPWAITLRQEFVEKFIENDITESDYNSIWISELKGNVSINKFKDIAYWCIENVTNAHEWIDNKDYNFMSMFDSYYKEALKTDEERQQEKAIEEIKTESIVYPESKVTNSIVEITYTKDTISCKLDHKNENFRLLVKDLGYGWNNGKWAREISSTAGKVEDRVAELGNKLLNAGFPIMILDDKVRNNAINGIYEKEHTRWIYLRTSGDYAGCLAIKWHGYNNSLYEKAKSIPGAHWDSGYMILKVMHYKELEDFANLYDFKFTTAAQKAIEDYKREVEKIPVVKPTEVAEEKLKDGLKEILNSSSEVLKDLKDD